MRTRFAVIPVLGVLVAASLGASSAMALPTKRVAPSVVSSNSVHTVHVTVADSGRRFTVGVGDHVVIRLAGASIYKWTEPSSAHPSVLQRTSGSSGNPATATFVAVGGGRSEVTSVGTPVCYPQCLLPSRLFEIKVKVMG